MTQATIYRAFHGQVRGTKYIHLIARELGCTAAYLTGEVDDTSANDPPLPQLDRNEKALLQLYRGLDRKLRQTLLQVARTLSDDGAGR